LNSATTRDRVTVRWYGSWTELDAAPLASDRYIPDAGRYRGEEALRYNYFSDVVYDVQIVHANQEEGTMHFDHLGDSIYDVKVVRGEGEGEANDTPEPFDGWKFVRANYPEPREPVGMRYRYVDGSLFLLKEVAEPSPGVAMSASTAREYHSPQSMGAFCSAWTHEARATLDGREWVDALSEALGDADGKRVKVTYRRRLVPSDFVPEAVRRVGCAARVACRDLSHPPIITPAQKSSCPFQEPW